MKMGDKESFGRMVRVVSDGKFADDEVDLIWD